MGRNGAMTGDRWRRDRSRRNRGRRAAKALRVVRDAEAVFRTAILVGVLSAERSERNWAGHYLYMFHDEDGTAWFKHRDTRAYVSMSARREAAAGSGA